MASSHSPTCIVLFVIYLMSVHSNVEGLCQANGVPHVEDANARFALMLQLRTPHSTNECQITAKGLQHYLTVQWLINRINSYNNNTGYIPGVKFGYTHYDDCGKTIYTARNSVSFFNNSLSYMSSTCGELSQAVPNIGIIGSDNSDASVVVSSLLKDHKIPIISPSSTVTELSDKTLYPTFLRTVPSDEDQMTLVVDMLDKLKWTYIALVYQNDDYGISGKNVLTKKAKERGICIHKTDLVLPQEDGAVGDHFENILNSAHMNSIAVVIIASTPTQAENLLYALDIRVEENKRGLHFILLDAVNTDISVFKDEKQGQGTLSISTANPILQMDDLKQDLNEMFDHYASKVGDHELIDEYIKTYGKPQVFIPNNLDSFLPSTIHAVMALIQGLKSLHSTSACAGEGICTSLRNKVEQGELLKEIKKIEVSYSSIPKAIIPAKFHDSGFSYTFDSNGNIHLGTTSPSYTVYSYDANIKNYKQVGMYTDGKMSLNVSNVSWLSPNGNPMNGVPTSMCGGQACNDCKKNKPIPMMYQEGDVYIIGIFSLHKPDPSDPFKCGEYRTLGNDIYAAEAFLYAVEKMRKDTGIKFGVLGFDDCYSQHRMISIFTDFFSDNSPLKDELFRYKIPREKIVAVIGCLSSGCTIPTTTFFMTLNIPVISYASSSADLDDKIDFPYFLRSVPSDVYQAQVMVGIIKKMGWEYVGLLYVNNNYGAKGMKAFRQEADKDGSGICTAKEIAISEKKQDGQADLYNARITLASQGVRVVVFFGIDDRYIDLINNLEESSSKGNFIFLGSEDWGNNERIKNAGVHSTRGSITLKFQDIGLENEQEFKQHLLNKEPHNDDSNVWFREFWQYNYNCYFRGGFVDGYNRECDMNRKLSWSEVNVAIKNNRVRHIMNVVYAVAKGLKEVEQNLCEGIALQSCGDLQSNPEKVADEIKKQMRNDNGEQFLVFDDNGNGAIGFNILSIQRDGSIYEYVEIGTFAGPGKEELQKDKVKFYDQNGLEITSVPAVCVQDKCEACKHRRSPLNTPKPPIENTSVSEYRDSDILVISLVIVLILAIAVLAVALVICFRRKYNVMVKKLESHGDGDIYEQIRTVYPGNCLPTITNLPVSDPDISPYVLCNTFNREGVNNPTFVSDSDRIESVSQVITNRAMNIDVAYTPTTSGNFTTQNSIQAQASYGQQPNRPLSSTSAGQPIIYQSEIDYQDSRVPNNTVLRPSSQGDQSVVYTSMNVPLNTNPQVIYNQDRIAVGRTPNGQLVAYKTSGNEQPVSNMQQSTIQNTINPEFGPYSHAAARQQEQSRMSQLSSYSPVPIVMGQWQRQSAEVPTSNSMVPIDYGHISYENIEMQAATPAGQPTNINSHSMPRNQILPQAYAGPAHIISNPATYSIPIPNPQTHSNLQSNSVPQPNSVNMAMMDPSLQNTWTGSQSSSGENSGEAEWKAGEDETNNDGVTEEDRGLYHYPDSNSLSSIPDVISGKMPQTPASPLKVQRDISLESINLETNTDVDYEIPDTPQKPRKMQSDSTQQSNATSVV